MRRWCSLALALAAAGCLSTPAFDPGDDGILPCAMETGFDEDVDRLDDGCDPCPAVAGPDSDMDQDGVGDACDPEPGLANTRLWFDGFNTTECLSPTLPYCDAGTTVPGAYAFSSTTTGAILFAGTLDRVEVTTGFDVIGIEVDADFNELGLVLAGAPSAVQGDQVQGCLAMVGHDSNGADYVELNSNSDGSEGCDYRNQTVPGLDLTVAVPGLELRCRLAHPNVSCVLEHAGMATSFSTITDFSPGRIGVFGREISATFRYVDVVALAPPM